MRLRVTGLPQPSHVRRAPVGGVAHYRGGQFVSSDLIAQQRTAANSGMEKLLTDFDDRLQFLRQVYEQNAELEREGKTKVDLLPLSTIERRVQAAIRETYAEAFQYGKRAAGNLFAITKSENIALTQLRRDEFQYLSKFMEDIREDSGVMPYFQRMTYYTMAARESYWLGWVMGDRNPKRRISWIYGDTQHCKDCLRFYNHGPYSIGDFLREVVGEGYLPQGGRLACLGRWCKCRLVAVK